MSYIMTQPEQIFATITRPWVQIKLGSVEDYDVKAVIYEGEYHWHRHQNHDEFIFVYDGNIEIEFEHEKVMLKTGEGIFVKRGTRHKSSSIRRSKVLLFERTTIIDDYVMG